MGSRPPLWTIVAAGIAAMATIARLLSVTFTASTTPLSASPRRRTTPAAALFGGVSSEVTTNSPDLRRLANALKEKDLSFYPSREVFQFGRPSHLSLGLPIGTELAPQRVSTGCRGVIGPFPQPLWMKGIAYEVSGDASTYTSRRFSHARSTHRTDSARVQRRALLRRAGPGRRQRRGVRGRDGGRPR